jgi:membrane protease YdiL (CAAX protease family)
MRENRLFRALWRGALVVTAIRASLELLARCRRRVRGWRASLSDRRVVEDPPAQHTASSILGPPGAETPEAVSGLKAPEGVVGNPNSHAETRDRESRGRGRSPAAIALRDAAAPLVCVAACICVEAALIAPGHELAGEIVDAALIFIFLQFAPSSSRGATRSRLSKAAICALALVPLIRVAALGLPLRDGSDPVGLLAVAVLVGVTAVALAPSVGVSRRTLLAASSPRSQLPVILAGLLLGFVAYLVGAPALWPVGAAAHRVLLGLLAAGCAAAAEEIVFRGVVQVTLQRAAGRAGVLAASAVFASIYLGANSVSLVLVFALAGLVFAHTVARTGTLAAAIAGHVLLVLGAGAIWPALLGRVHPSWISQPAATIELAVGMAGMTAILVCVPLQYPLQPSLPEGWAEV